TSRAPSDWETAPRPGGRCARRCCATTWAGCRRRRTSGRSCSSWRPRGWGERLPAAGAGATNTRPATATPDGLQFPPARTHPSGGPRPGPQPATSPRNGVPFPVPDHGRPPVAAASRTHPVRGEGDALELADLPREPRALRPVARVPDPHRLLVAHDREEGPVR